MTDLVQILVSGLTVGSVIALVAFGYNLVFAATRIVNFAQGSMLVVAGYIAFAVYRAGAPIWLAFLVSVVASLGVGVLVVARSRCVCSGWYAHGFPVVSICEVRSPLAA